MSRTGSGRVANEDRVAYVLPGEDDRRAARGALAVIADGMGGHAAGEVASALAAEIVLRRYYEDKAPPAEALAHGLREANDVIFAQASVDPAEHGMGTTCTAVAVVGAHAYVAHVGDSRLYRYRSGMLRLLTRDHSLVEELVRARVIGAAEAHAHPDRHLLVRALGTHPTVDIDGPAEGWPVRPGDMLLLCTDGLTDVVDDAGIAGVLAKQPSPWDACRMLLQAAVDGGGLDDVSVGVFVVGSGRDDDQSAPEVPVTRTLPAA